MTRMLATLFIALLLTACGSDDDPSSSAFHRTLDLGPDFTATFDMSEVTNASADITVTIEMADGSDLNNTDVTVTPAMDMVSGMAHDTPMSSRSGPINENNQFKTKAYFLMPSGEELGEWSFTVAFDGEEDSFIVNVDMETSERKMLKGIDDKIAGMNGGMAMSRSYFIFNEGREVSDSFNQFSVYIAAREYMTKHTSLVDGMSLTGSMMDSTYDLEDITVLIEMCATECGNNISWVTADADTSQPGKYTGDLDASTDKKASILVRIKVDSEVKTTTGTTGTEEDNVFEYATFDFSNN